uniref:Uncharacterized protein n=1 Tax=viral metagenome TaxID=1070528 RepID=A0A6C0BYS9_9ZZZZ
MQDVENRTGVIVTGDIVYMFCQRDGGEDIYGLLASSSMRISRNSSIQDALWSKDTRGQLQTLQPLVLRAALNRVSGADLEVLPNGTPISDQCVIFIEAINDEGTTLALTPRPSFIGESELMADAWRHAPVMFTSGPDKHQQATNFTLVFENNQRFLVTGSLLKLSTSFGALRLDPSADLPSSQRLLRLTSGFFESNVSFAFRRFASIYRGNNETGCVLTPATEAVSTPIFCTLDGSDCRTLDRQVVYWNSCQCQKNQSPDDKT